MNHSKTLASSLAPLAWLLVLLCFGACSTAQEPQMKKVVQKKIEEKTDLKHAVKGGYEAR